MIRANGALPTVVVALAICCAKWDGRESFAPTATNPTNPTNYNLMLDGWGRVF